MEAAENLRRGVATDRPADLPLADGQPVTLRAFILPPCYPARRAEDHQVEPDGLKVRVPASADVAAEQPTPRPTHLPLPTRHAPRLLRGSVGSLVVIFVVALGGLVAEHAAPRWFAGIRNVATPQSQTQTAARPLRPIAARRPDQASRPTPSLRLVSATLSSASYVVADSSYTVEISIDHPCWISVTSSASGRTFSTTLQPSEGPNAFTVSGAISMMVAARANSISIWHGSELLGRINAPLVGLTYDFTPAP